MSKKIKVKKKQYLINDVNPYCAFGYMIKMN